MANIRKRYSAQEKAKIVLDILKGEMTQSQLIAKYGINSGQLYKWKKQAVGSIVSGFSEKQSEAITKPAGANRAAISADRPAKSRARLG